MYYSKGFMIKHIEVKYFRMSRYLSLDKISTISVHVEAPLGASHTFGKSKLTTKVRMAMVVRYHCCCILFGVPPPENGVILFANISFYVCLCIQYNDKFS